MLYNACKITTFLRIEQIYGAFSLKRDIKDFKMFCVVELLVYFCHWLHI